MPRFTIRDLLWLTAVVAMGLGWYTSDRSLRNALSVTELQMMAWRHAFVQDRPYRYEYRVKGSDWEPGWGLVYGEPRK